MVGEEYSVDSITNDLEADSILTDDESVSDVQSNILESSRSLSESRFLVGFFAVLVSCSVDEMLNFTSGSDFWLFLL